MPDTLRVANYHPLMDVFNVADYKNDKLASWCINFSKALQSVSSLRLVMPDQHNVIYVRFFARNKSSEHNGSYLHDFLLLTSFFIIKFKSDNDVHCATHGLAAHYCIINVLQ